jgi:peptidyl-prolyl cis-trans isomerase D
MNYLNESRISQQAIRDNIDNNIIEELLSGLISTTLISLEIEELDLSITELTVLQKIKKNKNFLDENNVFQRTKYEKFLLTNNMSAPMYELQLKNKELQKHLFDFIGAGTITPEFLLVKKFEEENKSLNLEYFPMENFYKNKEDLTNSEIENFLKENKDLLKREYIDFKYVTLNPRILIGLEEFNQDFFDEIDQIENKISQGFTFEAIIKNINANVSEIKEYTPSATKKLNEDMIYSKRSSELDIIENGDNFILYTITNKYNRGPDLTDQNTNEEIRELVYQKSKFDLNKSILKEIQKKDFNEDKFKEMANYNTQYLTIKSINDHDIFGGNSVKILYSLPKNSFTLINDKENKIYLVKLTGSSKNLFKKTDENYLKFLSNQYSKNRMTILKSYDQLLNEKYQVQLNQKTIDRVKNYFK